MSSLGALLTDRMLSLVRTCSIVYTTLANLSKISTRRLWLGYTKHTPRCNTALRSKTPACRDLYKLFREQQRIYNWQADGYVE